MQLLRGAVDTRSDTVVGEFALHYDQVEALREEQRPQRYLATVRPHWHVRVAQNFAVGVARREATGVVQAAPRVGRIDHGARLMPDQLQQFGRLRQPGTGGIAERRVAVLQAATQCRDVRGHGGFEHAQIPQARQAVVQIPQRDLGLAEGDGLRLVGQPNTRRR